MTTIDVALHRLCVVATVRAGGFGTIRPVGQSVLGLGFAPNAFDTVTVLEVLEHIESPATAVRELLRVARRFVVASVPSKADDNPQHIQLFGPEDLRTLFSTAGAHDVRVDHVLNHRIAVVRV